MTSALSISVGISHDKLHVLSISVGACHNNPPVLSISVGVSHNKLHVLSISVSVSCDDPPVSTISVGVGYNDTPAPFVSEKVLEDTFHLFSERVQEVASHPSFSELTALPPMPLAMPFQSGKAEPPEGPLQPMNNRD